MARSAGGPAESVAVTRLHDVIVVNRYVAAVRRAANVVDVPGAPRSLRLDNVEVVGDRVRLRWSFVDPEVMPNDRNRHGRRIRGELQVRRGRPGEPNEVARQWWAQAQLAAAGRYKMQVDADWIPGEPATHQVWTTEQAWQALLTHLGSYGAEVRVEDGAIRVVEGSEVIVYGIDPGAWREYVAGPDVTDAPRDSDVVPAATPLVDGLPLWVVDELVEAAGAWGNVVGLVDGRLVGHMGYPMTDDRSDSSPE